MLATFIFSFSHFFIFISLKFRIYFYNGLHGLYGFFVAKGDDGRCRTIRMAGAAEAQKSV